MQARLSNLIAIFDNLPLDFRTSYAEGNDILSDAYEYLMRHFASEAGKSKGQFYTPPEVSHIMAKVIGINKVSSQSQTIYDPTCGSGSLLLKAADEAGSGVVIYGQEMDNVAVALAKMNMLLHDNPTAQIWQDNSLSNPHFKDEYGHLKTFDFVVANPPFSNRAWSNSFDATNDLYGRFIDGVPPAKNGDYAFLLHIIHSLKNRGKGAVILPYGILFRDNTEAEIREKIVKKGYIKGIIGLPPNLFYGTGIPACIIVLDKENSARYSGIFMIDASKDFIKEGNQNHLRHRDIRRIIDVFSKQIEIPEYSRLVSIAEIEENGYNLNISIYFAIYNQPVTVLFKRWQTNNISNLKNFNRGGYPLQLINILSEDMLHIFSATELIDKYDIYQQLMNYWSDVMQDDVYVIAQNGWQANHDLIPPPLIIKRYFATEQQQIEQLEAARDEITRQLDELEEVYGSEGGLLEETKNEKGKITKTSINARLLDIMTDTEAKDERAILHKYLTLLNKEVEASKKVRTEIKNLDAKVDIKYTKLSEDEIKTLVVDDKWLTELASKVQSELNNISQDTNGPVKEFEAAHAASLPRSLVNIEISNDIKSPQSNRIKAVKIFYCYAHQDRKLRDQLDNHMEPLRRSGKVVTWHDREILAGAEWKHEIDKHLKTSKIVLLLISPDFIKSDYCYSVEMQEALLMQKMGTARIIPVILRPVNWQETVLSELQVVPRDGKPITDWRNKDNAFQNVVAEIQKVIDIFLDQNS